MKGPSQSKAVSQLFPSDFSASLFLCSDIPCARHDHVGAISLKEMGA